MECLLRMGCSGLRAMSTGDNNREGPDWIYIAGMAILVGLAVMTVGGVIAELLRRIGG